jgi:hypothetical protein
MYTYFAHREMISVIALIKMSSKWYKLSYSVFVRVHLFVLLLSCSYVLYNWPWDDE